MKRYFGLFTKNQNNANNVHHSDNENPVVANKTVVIHEQEAPVVEHVDNKVVDEVKMTPVPEVIEDKPKRKRRSKKASDSPSDNQEVGDN